MTALADLLKAILENPDDDGLRLVYADELNEAGEHERAELIRVQLELAKDIPECTCEQDEDCPVYNYASRRDWLRRRERELLFLAPTWSRLGDFAIICMNGEAIESWKCGFIEAIECTAQAWLQHADIIIQWHPIREVTLTTCPVTYTWVDNKNRMIEHWMDRGLKRALVRLSQIEAKNYQHAHELAVFVHRGLLEKFWPGITFHLPVATSPQPT